MSKQNIARAFLSLWWTLGFLLVIYSVRTAWQSVAASSGIDVHVAILASAEVIAGLLFLIPKTMRAGGVCLLAVFALALVLHGRKGEFEGQLLIYSVAVSLVMVHGPLPIRALIERSTRAGGAIDQLDADVP